MTAEPRKQIDIDEARRLLDALERDLHSTDGRAGHVDTLMAELAALRAVLDADDRTHDDVERGLRGMRERLHPLSDELVGDAVRVGRYLSEIGRIIGLG